MELLHQLALGFEVALSPQNLLATSLGTLVGLWAGALPGMGAIVAMTLLLPFVHFLGATATVVLLAGIYCGAGLAGPRQTAEELGSVLAACVAALALALLAPPVARLVLGLEPAEYFSLIVLGLVCA